MLWNFAQLNIGQWHVSIASYVNINERFNGFSWYLMTRIAVKLIVFKNGKYFELCTYLLFLVDFLLFSRIGDRPHMFSKEVEVKLFCFGLYLMRVWFCYDFFYYRLRVLVVNNVCDLIFIIVLSISPIFNNFYRPSSVALLYFIGCLLNDVYVFESFLSLHHLVAN